MRFVGIDPSTKTGLVILNEEGKVLVQKEITGIGDIDPKRTGTLIQDLILHLKKGDIIAIEGFSYGSTGRSQAFQYGLGSSIRVALWARKLQMINATPGQLKKFGTGKGNTKKEDMPGPIMEHWGWAHRSDNVTDAFVLAQIAFTIHGGKLTFNDLPKHQKEVVEAILNPPSEEKKKKVSKKKVTA